MFKKKDPDRKIAKDELSDDDPIIELTDEVIIEPEEDRRAASSKTEDYIPLKTDPAPSNGEDENFIDFEENQNSSLQDDPFIKTDGSIAEDDNRIGFTDKFKPGSSGDDDVFIMDNGQDEVDGDLTAIIDDDNIEMTRDEIRNSFGEENELEFESEGDEIDFFAEDDELADDDEIIAMPSDLSPTFAEDDGDIDMLSDLEFEQEENEDNIPTAELDNHEIETDDEIIEIVEFDRHYQDEDEIIAQAGLLDRSALEDENFLEHFNADEKDPPEDEEIRELSESEDKAVEDEMRRFFDDAFEDSPEIEDNAARPVQKFSERDTNLDLTMSAAALSSGVGKFDRPDLPLPQDPAKYGAFPPKDQTETDEHLGTYSPPSNSGDATVVSPGNIDRAIERIINEKFAGRIEHIIYEIIEKAVKREIDRLKKSLLEDRPHEDQR